jgi:hypothetical protein
MAESNLQDVQLIYNNENIGDSLPKINNNFTVLKDVACTLEKRIDSIVNVRTFFYYGPNSATDPESGLDANNLTLPSKTTIQNFVNKSSGLDLPQFSKTGDIAYVVYQKTGWYNTIISYNRSGSGSVPYTYQYQVLVTYRVSIGIGGIGGRYRYYQRWETRTATAYAGYSWEVDISDYYNIYTPVFIVYKLTYNGSTYNVDTGFPKFSRASTASTINWNNPSSWAIY